MEIRELRTFLTLAELLNYQKASEQLGYAPSTLSHHVRTLENELGVALFAKVGKQIQLTVEGAAFIEPARRLLLDYEAALDSVATAVAMPYSSTARFEQVYGLKTVQLDEEDIWMTAHIVCRSYETLRPTARSLVRHSQLYSQQLIARDAAHYLAPQGDARRSVR